MQHIHNGINMSLNPITLQDLLIILTTNLLFFFPLLPLASMTYSALIFHPIFVATSLVPL